MSSQTGKFIILAGVIIVVIGIIIYFFSDKLSFLGKLPGDIRIEKKKLPLLFSHHHHDHT